MTVRKARNVLLLLVSITLANIAVDIATGPGAWDLIVVALAAFATGVWAAIWTGQRQGGAD